jgi:hypothetical protein
VRSQPQGFGCARRRLTRNVVHSRFGSMGRMNGNGQRLQPAAAAHIIARHRRRQNVSRHAGGVAAEASRDRILWGWKRSRGCHRFCTATLTSAPSSPSSHSSCCVACVAKPAHQLWSLGPTDQLASPHCCLLLCGRHASFAAACRWHLRLLPAHAANHSSGAARAQ